MSQLSLNVPTVNDKLHIHLDNINHNAYEYYGARYNLRRQNHDSDQDDWKQSEQFAYQFQPTSITLSIHVQGCNYRYASLAEVWMWYHYYIAHVRTWVHNQSNQSYWSRVPSHYRSLKHADEKARKLKKILVRVFNQNSADFIRHRDWMDHNCGFNIISQPSTME